jgi:uncharacterized damage-inducible protein DinB
MTWTAPTPPAPVDGPLTGDDRAILEGFLASQRSVLLTICAGLTPEQLVEQAVPPSRLSLLGLVRHLAKVERIWLRQGAAGEEVEPMYDPSLGKDIDFEDLDPDRAAYDLSRYQKECELADAAVAELPFDHEFERKGETFSLRATYVHLISEYARHNGHADLLREKLDGVTGL